MEAVNDKIKRIKRDFQSRLLVTEPILPPHEYTAEEWFTTMTVLAKAVHYDVIDFALGIQILTKLCEGTTIPHMEHWGSTIEEPMKICIQE